MTWEPRMINKLGSIMTNNQKNENGAENTRSNICISFDFDCTSASRLELTIRAVTRSPELKVDRLRFPNHIDDQIDSFSVKMQRSRELQEIEDYEKRLYGRQG
jgi:hypothetical protein